MSKQGITALYERAQADDEFIARLEAASSPEEKHRIVSEAGFDVEPDDLDTLRSVAGLSELSDEDLERVAGGNSATNVAEIGGVAAGPAVAATAAAVAAI